MTDPRKFRRQVREELAKRAGNLCSRPGCNRLAIGPRQGPSGIVDIGVAAHIFARAPGGPRYLTDLPDEQCASILNGIWLCANCARKIDDSHGRDYPPFVLWKWKHDHEQLIRLQMEDPAPAPVGLHGVADSDVRLVDIAMEEVDDIVRLDLKVRNVGANVAFIKLVRLLVLDVGRLGLIEEGAPKGVPVSSIYPVALDPMREPPYPVDIVVSERVFANGVERLVIRVAFKAPPPPEKTPLWGAIFRCRLQLCINEDNRIVESNPFIFQLQSPHASRSFERLTPLKEVKRTIFEMLELPGDKSPALLWHAEAWRYNNPPRGDEEDAE